MWWANIYFHDFALLVFRSVHSFFLHVEHFFPSHSVAKTAFCRIKFKNFQQQTKCHCSIAVYLTCNLWSEFILQIASADTWIKPQRKTEKNTRCNTQKRVEKKYQAIQHRPYKVKHTSIQWIDCMVHLERAEKTQLKWKTISDTLILYHLCVSVFQEKHRLSNGTPHSIFFLLYSLNCDPFMCSRGSFELWRKKMYFKNKPWNWHLIFWKNQKKSLDLHIFWVLSIISNNHQLFCFYLNRKNSTVHVFERVHFKYCAISLFKSQCGCILRKTH